MLENFKGFLKSLFKEKKLADRFVETTASPYRIRKTKCKPIKRVLLGRKKNKIAARSRRINSMKRK